MSVKRILAGIAVMVATAWALSFASELLNLDRSLAGPVSGGLSLLISALLGGFVARSGFVLPAVLVWSVVWAAIIYILYRIAEPTGASSVINLLSYNAVALGTPFVGACIGAVLGQRMARHFTASQPVAT